MASSNEDWEKKFRHLKRFKKAHGHCDVPYNLKGGLGRWVERLRTARKNGSLDSDNEEMLDELGFQWSTSKQKRTPKKTGPVRAFGDQENAQEVTDDDGKSLPAFEERWKERFAELLAFREKYGNCNVHRLYRGGLGRWVHYQRIRKSAGNLSRERQEKLENIGLKWTSDRESTQGYQVRSVECFEERFRQLEEFKSVHGDCNVPLNYPNGLRGFVDRKRQQKKHGTIKKQEEERLDAIGFIWNANVPWESRFKELEEFKVAFGHCNVPLNYEANPQLAKWISRQRTCYSNLALTEERIVKLEALGFQWKPKRGRTPR